MKKLHFILCCILIITTFAYAHSGRTDSKGGHYNRSTGEYHYHHGKPAHEICGVNCPYLSKSVKTTSSNSVDWDFISLCELAFCCLIIGFVLRAFIFLPLLIIDYFLKKEYYEKFVINHSFISSLMAGILFFFIFLSIY